jgi:hypothetical protein
MKAIKKACSGTSLYPKKSSVSSKLKAGGSVKKKSIPKAQLGRLVDKVVSRQSNRMLDRVVKNAPGMTDKAVDYGKVVLTDAQKAKNAEILNRSKTTYVDKLRKEASEKAKKSDARRVAAYQAKLDALKQRAASKNKAKDGKWIQKAVNPAHKGYCTPMTKATCTPRRKALAKTFKKMAKERKSK